jgi:hypothetical protein
MNVLAKVPLTDRRLERFFRSELLPIARQYQHEGRSLLDGNPDPTQPTYYQRRTMTKMSKADFESGSCRDSEELAAALNAMWRKQGFDELAELAPRLAQLAERLKQTQPDTEDVSPFIYAMY